MGRRSTARGGALVALALVVSSCSSVGSSDAGSSNPKPSAAQQGQGTPGPPTTAAPQRKVVGPDGAELRIPAGSFPDDVTPQLSVGEQVGTFLSPFAIGEMQPVVSVTSPQQPSGPVELVMPYAPSAVPDGAVPVVFYFDTDLELWLPVHTRADAAASQLIATVDHFTDFTTGFLRVVNDVVDAAASGVDWFSYQVADAVGARADEPSCDSAPVWVAALTVPEMDMERNRPLMVCAESDQNDPDLVDVKVALNRPYSLTLNLSQKPVRVSYEPSPQVDDAVGIALSQQFAMGDKSVLVPARGTVDLFFERNSAVHITGNGTLTVSSVVLDAAMTAVAVGSVFATSKPAQRVEAYDCTVGALDQGVRAGSLLNAAGAWTAVAQQCLDPIVGQLVGKDGVAQAAWKKLVAGVSLSFLLGRAGQGLFDAGRALNEPHSFTMDLVPDVAPVDVANLAGTWVGPVNQPSSQYLYSAVIHLSPSLTSGTVSYPGRGKDAAMLCSGTLTLVHRSDTAVVLDENITDDPEHICVIEVEVTLEALPGKAVRYSARWGDFTDPPGALAVLTPQ